MCNDDDHETTADALKDETADPDTHYYQITWLRVEDDAWVWRNVNGLSFQGACRYGLYECTPGQMRLLSVTRHPGEPKTGYSFQLISKEARQLMKENPDDYE